MRLRIRDHCLTISLTNMARFARAVYDLAENNVYLSFARKSSDDGKNDREGDMAFERTFTRIDTAALFSTPQPSE